MSLGSHLLAEADGMYPADGVSWCISYVLAVTDEDADSATGSNLSAFPDVSSGVGVCVGDGKSADIGSLTASL